MNRILKDTKQIYYDYMFYDEVEGDSFVKNPKTLERDKMSGAEFRFVKRYLSLVMMTSIVSESTKEYIRSNMMDSTAQVVKSIVGKNKRSKNGGCCNENTMLAMINYDIRKLQKFFDDDMLLKIKEHSYGDFGVYEEQLNLAIAKFGKPSELKGELALDVPVMEISGVLSDDEFKVLLEIVKPYSKAVMKQVVENMPENLKAYLNFLLFVEEKSQLDKERYEALKKILMDGLTAEEVEEMKKRFILVDGKTKEEKIIEREVATMPSVESNGIDADYIIDLGYKVFNRRHEIEKKREAEKKMEMPQSIRVQF